MKKVKVIVLFLIVNIFSYANYLISNSEIVLFYDKTQNKIEYIRGDIFHNFDISRVDPKLLINNEVLNLNDYVEDVSVIGDTNILKIIYNIHGEKINMEIIPSMLDKGQLIFVIDLSKAKIKDNIDFVFQIVPQYDNKLTKYDKIKKVYNYDKFNFTSNYSGELFISRNSRLEEFILEEVREPVKKYEEDNLYYIIKNVNNVKNLIFNIDFYIKDGKSKNVSNNILDMELKFWEISNIKNTFSNTNSIVKGQLKNLEIISSRVLIPNEISLNRSKEDLNSKIKLIYVNSFVDKKFDVNRFFEDINIRKKDSEAVIYYTMLFRYLNDSNNYLNKELFERKISLEVLSLLDYIELHDNSIVNIRDNIQNYAWYFRLIKNIKNRSEFAEEKNFIEEKEILLREYVVKNYLLNDGLKTQKDDNVSNYRNIAYIDFLPQDIQKKILNRDYTRYYNKKYGLLIPMKEKRLDLEYNLNFIIALYKNKEYKLANKLLENVEKLIEKNNQFLLPQLSTDKDNTVGIYSEMLYLYFIALKLSQEKTANLICDKNEEC